MRALRIYSLDKFHIKHTVVLTVCLMLSITSVVLIYLITGSLYHLLTGFIQSLLPQLIYPHYYLPLPPLVTINLISSSVGLFIYFFLFQV